MPRFTPPELVVVPCMYAPSDYSCISLCLTKLTPWQAVSHAAGASDAGGGGGSQTESEPSASGGSRLSSEPGGSTGARANGDAPRGGAHKIALLVVCICVRPRQEEKRAFVQMM